MFTLTDLPSNQPDGQRSLELWEDGRDPNLYKRGLFEFVIDAARLRNLTETVTIPRRAAPTLIVELTNETISCHTRTNEGSFGVSAWERLNRSSVIGASPVRFEVSTAVFSKLAKPFKRALYCVYDYNFGSLSWMAGEEEEKPGRCCIAATWMPPKKPEVNERVIGKMKPRNVSEGLNYASIMIQRKSPNCQHIFDGLQISPGAVTSGYHKAISRYRSSVLPDDFDITISKANVANARALLARLYGEAEVIDAGERIYVRTPQAEVFWTKGGSWPAGAKRAFDLPECASVILDTKALQQRLCLAAAVFEEVQVKVEPDDAGANIVISGANDRRKGFTKLNVLSEDCATTEARDAWDLTFLAKDLLDAACGVETTHTRLALLDRGLVVGNCQGDGERKTILLGSERL